MRPEENKNRDVKQSKEIRSKGVKDSRAIKIKQDEHKSVSERGTGIRR